MWTRGKLTPANLRWLQSLPEGPIVVDGAFAISHGTPIDEDAYIFGEIEALNVFRQTDLPALLLRALALPRDLRPVARRDPDGAHRRRPSFRFRLEPGVRYLVNPGSIGQPRDGNPLASFAMFDSETPLGHRLPRAVPLERAQRKILEAGLPRPLADRLALGR